MNEMADVIMHTANGNYKIHHDESLKKLEQSKGKGPTFMEKFDEHVILPPIGSVIHTSDNYFGDMLHAFCPNISDP